MRTIKLDWANLPGTKKRDRHVDSDWISPILPCRGLEYRFSVTLSCLSLCSRCHVVEYFADQRARRHLSQVHDVVRFGPRSKVGGCGRRFVSCCDVMQVHILRVTDLAIHRCEARIVCPTQISESLSGRLCFP